MLLIHPHELFIPATILSLLILFFYLFSDGLRDAFDLKCVNNKGGTRYVRKSIRSQRLACFL